MATYLIGDIQGCLEPLQRLLERIRFDPARDKLWPCGDLVNRGGDSLGVLRLLSGLPRVRPVLGNHDMALLAMAERYPEGGARNRELNAVLTAHDREPLLDWLRGQKLARYSRKHKLLRVHAGVIPQWTTRQTLAYAREVETALAGPQRAAFLSRMRGSKPKVWRDDRSGWGRLRLITRILTTIRFCADDGRLLDDASGPPGTQPEGYLPWFSQPQRRTSGVNVAFGHWAALGVHMTHNLAGLDSGCVWGGRLTAVRVQDRAIFQVPAKPRPAATR